MISRSRLAVLLCLLWGLVLDCAPKVPPVAHVTQAKGPIGLHSTHPGAGSFAPVGASLYEEDVVSTGPQSSATITFAGGNKVILSPNSSLVIRRQGGSKAEFGAVMITGSAQLVGGGQGVLVAIGTPYGGVEFGMQVGSAIVSVDNGVAVQVGGVDVFKDNQRKALAAGQEISVAGLALLLGGRVNGLDLKLKQKVNPSSSGSPSASAAASADGVDAEAGVDGVPDGPETPAEPVKVVLLAKPKQAQVLGAGQKNWRTVKSTTTLTPGDHVRVKKVANGTRLQFGKTAALTLGGNTHLVLGSATESNQQAAADYALRIGGIQVRLLNQNHKKMVHKLKVAGANVKLLPTLREAQVEVNTTAKGAQVLIRYGQVVVGDGAPIEAGSMIEIAHGKIVGAVKDLTDNKVDVKAKSNTVIYYDKKSPAVNFVWGQPSSTAQTIEIATDKDFKQVLAIETIKRGHFVTDQLPPGKYFWRLNKDSTQIGTLKFVNEDTDDCKNCQHTNIINDTGEKTVIYFQKSLPAVTLHWEKYDKAVSYNVKVFHDGEFEKPLVDLKTSTSSYAFASGRFDEGRYYWLATPLDKQGDEIEPGRMNALHIVYDNVVTSLVIRVPKQNWRTPVSRMTTSGDVEPEAKLFINDKLIDLDDAGHFAESVNLRPGNNHLIYRAICSDGIEHVYLRDVLRR